MSEEDIDEEEIIEAEDWVKEQRYFNSLSLMDLGTELYYTERQIEKFEENGNDSRLEKAKEYKKKVKKEINARMDPITEHEKEMKE